VRSLKALLVVALLFSSVGPVRAQSLPISLFERYLEALQQQANIPGLSAAIIQNHQIVWDGGFGYQDIDNSVRATASTPYPILELSQMLSSTTLFQQCVELRNRLQLSDRVRRWVSDYPDDITTIDQLLVHASPDGSFKYDPNRFSGLTDVVSQCASVPYPRLLAREILERLGMKDSVPGHNLAKSYAEDRRWFSASTLSSYTDVIRRVAIPYRVDKTGKTTKADYTVPALTAATGIVSTVRDLARFDSALDDDGLLIEASSRERAWQTPDAMPTGRGWFVQRYNGERIVWQFGVVRDAYSALYIKVPGRNLTLIMLANSDGLAAPYNLSNGDVTVSLFAQTFLKLFIN
jgi:CubicO group peptidase (beta-lactamase class C family)